MTSVSPRLMREFLEYIVAEFLRCHPDDDFGRGVWLWDARWSPLGWDVLLARVGIDQFEADRLLALVEKK